VIAVQFGETVRQKVPYRLKQLFERVPKTELHLHLGGSVRKRDVRTFMLENGVPPEEIPGLFKLIKPRYQNITEFLDAYYQIPKHVSTPSQFKRATVGIVKEAAKDNVKILEIRTSILKKGGSPQEVVEAVEEGIREGTAWVKAHKGYQMEASLTILAQRFGTSEDSLQSARLAVDLAKRPQSLIYGFDLAGDESKHSIEKHQEALEYIKQWGASLGIGLTIHAGETKSSEGISGLDSIKKALQYGTNRIGHALRLMDDDALKQYVTQNQIPIEMAPWSHVQIHAVDSYRKHPLRQFLEEGMNISLATDNRLMSNITLRKQLGQLWTNRLVTHWSQIKQLTVNGIQSAFLPETKQQHILQEVNNEFKQLEREFSDTIQQYLPEAPAVPKTKTA
jgi:adenosine deaminase